MAIPLEVQSDRWTVLKVSPAVLADYCATIEIELSTHYSNWVIWVSAWNNFSKAVDRLLLYITGFDTPKLLTIAEIAYFFAESNIIQRMHKNPVTLA